MDEIKFPLLVFGEEEFVQDFIRKVTDRYPSVVRISLPQQMIKTDGEETRYMRNSVMLIKPETIFEINEENVGDWRDISTWKYKCISYDENMNTEEILEIGVRENGRR